MEAQELGEINSDILKCIHMPEKETLGVIKSIKVDKFPRPDQFADNTKTGCAVDSKEDYLRVQWDLDQMGQWTKKWQMEFNLDKCEMLHFDRANQGRASTLNDKTREGESKLKGIVL
eukprot:g28253.t1